MRASAGSLLFGIFAVMFGLLGAYVVRKELHKPQTIAASVDDRPGTMTVPVASISLEAGRKVTLGDIALMKMTPAQMRAQKITGTYMSNTKQIIGRVLKREIKEGAAFDTPDFYPEGTGPSVAERLKKGYRAVTVSVEQDSAVAGFAIPGSMVDVIFRADSAKEGDDKHADELPETTVTLIEAAEVLALNQETAQVLRTADSNSGHSAAASKASVTLAVTPRQAASLRVVDGRGSLSLALRNKDDLDVSDEVTPRTLDDLLERARSKHKMEIYRGRHMTQTSFKNNERLTPTEPTQIADPIPTRAPVPQTAHMQPAPQVIIVRPTNALAP
jgi:pilus assembly protein CpaB